MLKRFLDEQNIVGKWNESLQLLLAEDKDIDPRLLPQAITGQQQNLEEAGGPGGVSSEVPPSLSGLLGDGHSAPGASSLSPQGSNDVRLIS